MSLSALREPSANYFLTSIIMGDFRDDSFISFVPIRNEDNDNHLISRNLAALASLASLANLSQPQHPAISYNLEGFKLDRSIDPSSLNIKEFSDSFKQIKAKLKGIEATICELERKRDAVTSVFEDVSKKLVDFFGMSETSEFLSALKNRACEMVTRLELDKFYEERNTLLQHYKVAVPLLSQVRQEFFGDSSSIPSCPICYENNVTHAVLPCGHCICEDCKKKLLSTCFHCRSPVVKINRIYI